MKIRVLMELEVSDLPGEERKELEDGINFVAAEDQTTTEPEDEDYVPTVPRLDEFSPQEITHAVRDMFMDGVTNLDTQRELWAGTEFYGYISDLDVLEINQVTDDKTAGKLEEDAEYRLGVAYQVIGVLASGPDGRGQMFEHPEIQKVLDYLSFKDGAVDPLPFVYPKVLPPGCEACAFTGYQADGETPCPCTETKDAE